MQHLKTNGKILAIGHANKPQSLYNNPQLYPQMLPWLFPYGFRGVGSHYQTQLGISDKNTKGDSIWLP